MIIQMLTLAILLCNVYRAEASLATSLQETTAEGTSQDDLRNAILEGNLETLKEFLQSGADLTARFDNGLNALHLAATIEENAVLITKELLQRDVINLKDVDEQGWTAVHHAAASENADAQYVIKELLEKDSESVDICDKSNRTALHVASTFGRTANVEMLLKHKASVIVVDKHGMQPLHYAAQEGWLAVIKALLAAKAPVSEKDKYKRTPLVLANKNLLEVQSEGTIKQPLLVILELLAHGADVTDVDPKANKPVSECYADKGLMFSTPAAIKRAQEPQPIVVQTKSGVSVLSVLFGVVVGAAGCAALLKYQQSQNN